MFDLKGKQALDVLEQPLIVMDSSLFSYQRLDSESALNYVELLATRCARYGGQFTLLWHNTLLAVPARRELYVDMLAMLRRIEQSASFRAN